MDVGEMVLVGKPMGMTMAEKVLARASGREEVSPGEYVTASIDCAMVHEGLAAVYMTLLGAGIDSVWDPGRIVAVLDHAVTCLATVLLPIRYCTAALWSAQLHTVFSVCFFIYY